MLLSREQDTNCHSVLNSAQRLGLSFTATAGFISLVSIVGFLGLIARNAIFLRRWPVRTHVDAYLLSLLVADLLQSLGAILDVRWIHHGVVQCSAFCAAQGVIQQLGETSVAMSTLTITIHTFFAIFFRWNPSKRLLMPILIITFIWLYSLIFCVVGYATNPETNAWPDEPFYTATPFWCWINSRYLTSRILGEYFWLWTTAILNVLVYIPLYFYLRGNIDVIDSENWRKIRIKFRRTVDFEDEFGFGFGFGGGHSERLSATQQLNRKEAIKMIWYPIAYSIIVLPVTITRWTTFSSIKQSPPPETSSLPFVTTGVVVSIFGLSGLVNTLLFLITRPSLLLFGEYRRENPDWKWWTRKQRIPRRTEDVSISPLTKDDFQNERQPESATTGPDEVNGSRFEIPQFDVTDPHPPLSKSHSHDETRTEQDQEPDHEISIQLKPTTSRSSHHQHRHRLSLPPLPSSPPPSSPDGRRSLLQLQTRSQNLRSSPPSLNLPSVPGSASAQHDIFEEPGEMMRGSGDHDLDRERLTSSVGAGDKRYSESDAEVQSFHSVDGGPGPRRRYSASRASISQRISSRFSQLPPAANLGSSSIRTSHDSDSSTRYDRNNQDVEQDTTPREKEEQSVDAALPTPTQVPLPLSRRQSADLVLNNSTDASQQVEGREIQIPYPVERKGEDPTIQGPIPQGTKDEDDRHEPPCAPIQ